MDLGPLIGDRLVPPRLLALLLSYKLYEQVLRISRPPFITLRLIILLQGLFALSCMTTRYFPVPFRYIGSLLSANRLSIYPRRILRGELYRLFTPSLAHLSAPHVLYNSLALLSRGTILERRLGTFRFALLLVYLNVVENLIYVLVALAGEWFRLPHNFRWMDRPSAGASGVVFGLTVIMNYNRGIHVPPTDIMGFRVPGRQSHWTELVYTQLVMPNVSFLGHLSGIFAGFSYLYAEQAVNWIAERKWQRPHAA